MNNKIHFITYGDGRYEYLRAAMRLANQAKNSSWFDTVSIWNMELLKEIDPDWMIEHEQFIKSSSRGHGYWIWKPKIILELLNGVEENDTVVYIDGGSELNFAGSKRFETYLKIVDRYKFLFFYLNGDGYKISQWTKSHLTNKFAVQGKDDEYLTLPQMEAGCLFLKNTQATRNLIAQWLEIAVEDHYLNIDDTPSPLGERYSFIEHRHDQAILSLLFLKNEYGVALKNESYLPSWWGRGELPDSLPIMAFRNNVRELSSLEDLKMTSFELPKLSFMCARNEQPLFIQVEKDDLKDTKLELMDVQTPRAINLAKGTEGGPAGDSTLFFSSLNKIHELLKDRMAVYKNVLMDDLIKRYEIQISNNNKEIASKESVIQEQKKSLIDRLEVINEKQAVIEAQNISLIERLRVINQDKSLISELRYKIVQLENKFDLSKMSFPKNFFHRLRLLKYKFMNFIERDDLGRVSSNQGFIDSVLHQLRLFKHFCKRFPQFLKWRLKEFKAHTYLFINRLFCIELGYLGNEKPKPIKIPKSYLKNGPIASDVPRISVVTPSYMQGEYIERTIDSILSQKYPNLEYIIQDGGSTDGTVEKVLKYGKKIYSFQSIKDRGQSHAINLGMSKASGDILAWVNSDDILMPGALVYIANFFIANPDVDVIYGHRVLINTRDEQIGRWIMPPHNDEVLSWADYIPQETLFWRRRAWEKIGQKIDESFQFAMDWDLILRLQDVGAKFVRVPRLIGGFRIHTSQKTSSEMAKNGLDEMLMIRQRRLGRTPTQAEININVRQYIKKHQFENFKWKLKEYFHLL